MQFKATYVLYYVPMTKATLMTDDVEMVLRQLGKNLRTARLRRNLTQQTIASRAFVSIPTVRRAEAGDGGTTMATMASLLMALNLESQLADVAAPGRDDDGMARESRTRRQRAAPSKI